MKNTLIRLLAIMTLAGSMSAFATTEKAKSENTSTAASENSTCSCNAEQQTEENKKDREQQRLILEQEKQWEHDLHNISAG